MIHTPLVIGMAVRLVKRQRNMGCDIHFVLLEGVLQDTLVSDPGLLRCLLLHHWNLAMPCVLW